ncbi:hypothetical protein As57867_020525, partial [Aphanomyces stellatus]
MNTEAAVVKAQVVVDEAVEAVKNAQRRLDNWLVANPNDFGDTYRHLRDDLKEAREALKEAREALKEAREFYLRIREAPSHEQSASNASDQTAEPTGPLIDLTSTGILEFLETQMNDSAKFHTVPHLLSPSNLEFQLSGRDMALKVAADCMNKIAKPVSQTTKADRKIPVCAGLPGLGKSRMLEEWENIFDLAKIHGPRLGALVLYYNGHKPHVIEASMTIEASFSWRLLHRLFIEGNGV